MPQLGTILITGGTGFLGSVIVRLLAYSSYRVIVLVRDTSDTRRIASVLRHPRVTLWNIDRSLLRDCFVKETIYCVIHTATAYGRQGETPEEITRSNTDLPLHLIDAALRYHVPGFINTDTFFTEAMGVSDGEKRYIKTKKEFLRQARIRTAGTALRFINMIPEQIYGPDDNSAKFIPWVITALLRNTPEIALTGGEQKRDFIFVDDVARAYLSVLEHMDAREHFAEFCIGTGVSHSLRSVVEEVRRLCASGSTLQWGALSYRYNEIMDHAADVRANAAIGWQAGIPLSVGMKKTVSWYRTKL